MASSPYAQYSGQFVCNFLYIHKAKPPTHPETDAPKVPSFTWYLFPSPCITITPLLVCLSRNRNNAAFHASASSLSRFVRTRTFLLTYSPHKQMRIIAFQIYLQHALLNTPLSISVVYYYHGSAISIRFDPPSKRRLHVLAANNTTCTCGITALLQQLTLLCSGPVHGHGELLICIVCIILVRSPPPPGSINPNRVVL